MIATAAATTMLLLQIVTASPSPANVNATMAILQQRFSAFHLNAQVAAKPHGRILITVDGAVDPRVQKQLIAPGHVTFAMMPHGPTYAPGSERPVKSASVSTTMEELGPNLDLFLSDAAAFNRFTKSNVGKKIGIYLDGNLLFASIIMAPLSDEVEIHGAITVQQMHLLEAMIDSPPLPLKLKLAGP